MPMLAINSSGSRAVTGVAVVCAATCGAVVYSTNWVVYTQQFTEGLCLLQHDAYKVTIPALSFLMSLDTSCI